MTPELSPNSEKDKVRVIGFWSSLDGKAHVKLDCDFKTKKDFLDYIRSVFRAHHLLVGFNNCANKKGRIPYDNAVLYYNGMEDMIEKTRHKDFNVKEKNNFDMQDFFQRWEGSISLKEGLLIQLLMSHSLDFITKLLGLVTEEDGKIKDFDYSVLNKPKWTEEEKQYIIDYTMRDIEITKKLFDWIETFFDGMKDFLKDEDVKSKGYLKLAPSTFAYKSICKALDVEEEYAEKKHHTTYGGGYVAYPAGEAFEGNIYCLYFNSLYPSIMHQCNIYSPSKKGWTGNDKFKVEGVYEDEEQGEVEKLLKQWYEQRLVYKANKDPRQYSIKIIINTIYGLLGNESFKLLSNPIAAGDVTRLGRQWTKLARERFREKGYEIIYTDTDSVYLKDPFDDKEKMLKIKDAVIKEIKDNVPFPYEKFDMGVDAEISHMWFFKGGGDKITDDEMDEQDFIDKPKGFMKKNYIYLTKDGKVEVKNLGVRKKSTSALAREIFWKYLVPKIKEEKKIKFPRSWFEDLIYKLLEENISLAMVRWQVRPVDVYKNAGQLQAQIAARYGPGIHFLIRNKRFGAGKGVKYCSLEEFKKNNFTIDDMDLSGVWSELNYFIEGGSHSNTSLDEWFK